MDAGPALMAGLLMVIGAFVFGYLWSLWDCASNPHITPADRQMWLLVLVGSMIFGMGWITAIMYYMTRESRKSAFLEQQELEDEDRRPRRRSRRRRRPAYDD